MRCIRDVAIDGDAAAIITVGQWSRQTKRRDQSLAGNPERPETITVGIVADISVRKRHIGLRIHQQAGEGRKSALLLLRGGYVDTGERPSRHLDLALVLLVELC